MKNNYRPCPEGCGWAASFDTYFKRWRCYSCGWMPRSSVEAWRELRDNPRRGGPFPRGAVMSVEGLIVGTEYEFLTEAERGRWIRLAIRTFAGSVDAHTEEDESTLADDATPTGARLEFTHQLDAWLPGHGAMVQFWDGGAKDGWVAARDVIGNDATLAVVPVLLDGGARRRTEENLRRMFG